MNKVGEMEHDAIHNPQPGDKFYNRKARHPTRTVYDRTWGVGGDVFYFYNMRCKYKSRCELDEWIEYATNAKQLEIGGWT